MADDPILLKPGLVTLVVNAATGTGTGESLVFLVNLAPGGGDKVIEYDCTGTYSVCTADIDESPDTGTTWIAKQTAIDLKAAPSGYFNALAGKWLRFNITSFTGTSITVYVNES